MSEKTALHADGSLDAAGISDQEGDDSRDTATAGSNDTVTRADLSLAVNTNLGLSRNESAELVEAVIEEITQALERGEHVKIPGFGTFIYRDKAERIGRNPRTKEEVPIKPRRTLSFRPSRLLRQQVNEGNGFADPGDPDGVMDDE